MVPSKNLSKRSWASWWKWNCRVGDQRSMAFMALSFHMIYHILCCISIDHIDGSFGRPGPAHLRSCAAATVPRSQEVTAEAKARLETSTDLRKATQRRHCASWRRIYGGVAKDEASTYTVKDHPPYACGWRSETNAGLLARHGS